jgi:hypothetical protein
MFIINWCIHIVPTYIITADFPQLDAKHTKWRLAEQGTWTWGSLAYQPYIANLSITCFFIYAALHILLYKLALMFVYAHF